MRLLFLIAFCIACGSKEKLAPQADDLEILRSYYEDNLAKLKGIPSKTDCDGLLWAGLAKAGGVELDLDAFQSDSGELHRRPSKDCYETGDSRSSVSNDMIVGWAWGVYYSKDAKALEKFLQFAEDNKMIVGKPKNGVGEVLVKPNVQGLLGRLSYHLKLGSRPYGGIRLPYQESNKDYVKHIQTLMIALDGELSDKMPELDIKLVCKYAKEDKDDYLMAAVCSVYNGGITDAINLLIEEPEPPSYVRGDQKERYRLAHWLFTANYLLNQGD